MTCRSFLTSTAASLGLLSALAADSAAADVTAQQVWADWRSYMRGLGYEMTGTESQSGGALTVTDVLIDMQMTEEEGSFRITLPSITFTDNADRSVSVTLPETMPMLFDITREEGEALQGTVRYVQTAPTLVVTGDPTDMTYIYDVETVDISLDDLVVDGEAVPADTVKVAMQISDVSSVTRMQVGDLRSYDQDMTAAGLTYDVSFVVPEEEGGGTRSLKGSLQGLQVTGAGDLPMSADGTGMADMDRMLEAGMTMSGGFTYSTGSMDIDLRPPDGPLVGSTSSDGGSIDVGLGPQGFGYEVTQTNLSIDMQQVPEVPFPVSLQMARSAFNLTIPLLARDEAQDFALGFTLGDFTVTDTIWNLFDPAGQLPRDPATISVDLTGKAKMLVDVMDPEAAAMEPDAAPGQLEALDINSLLVSALGARLTGSGEFTFDNADTTTFDGMPMPLGSVDIRVEGANALIDKLVRMGLLPEDQAMGARMMMGLFGLPQGEDVLTSTIEVNEQGHVLANGQRLQ